MRRPLEVKSAFQVPYTGSAWISFMTFGSPLLPHTLTFALPEARVTEPAAAAAESLYASTVVTFGYFDRIAVIAFPCPVAVSSVVLTVPRFFNPNRFAQ